ncbi:glycosyl hydrolase family 18 protein [Alkaliphilus transvaalensis]|uniref:glycosyl hydrolase family 18 protein n=1 Tax=Alkaliphilus transvaalensis TaxID=114628 RepID=UPI0006870920|nr:glycosyl hydrolase family 18 protein [Alkaliphilus transvaalensis]
MKKILLISFLMVVMVASGLMVFTRMAEGSNFNSNGEEWKGKPVLEGQPIWTEVRVLNGEIYMPFDAVREFLYSDMEMNEEKNKALIKVNSELFQFENEELTDYVAGNEVVLRFNLVSIEGQSYLPINALQDVLGYHINFSQESERVIIDKKESNIPEGTLNKKAYLIDQPKTFAKRIVGLEVGETVKIFDEIDHFYFVRTESGELGYLRKNNIVEENIKLTVAETRVFKNKERWEPVGKIGLVWDYVYLNTKDRSNEEKIAAVDIFSPTWFDLLDEEGNIDNKGNFQYAKDMKEKGYEIWGLVTNSFDPDLTSSFLASEEAQDHFIRQILIYSGLYQLDGINIDFENIHYRDQAAFTSFVERLIKRLHQMNLVVSIDVTIPSTSPNWSMVYDRIKLGEIVDYVAVMTYDEHWASSPKSGSVASIGWVERGIQQTLQMVPEEKVLLGLPFYTRLWEEEVQSNGKLRVSSKAYGMKQIREILEENDAEIEWDEKTGQYYAEYLKDGKTYKVWLEDGRSLALKATLVEKYNLAGFAAWRKDFEIQEVWGPLNEIIKRGKSYEEIIR